MSVVDLVVPSYRGFHPEAYGPVVAMMQATNCNCREARTGAPLHMPWKCTNGKHSVRLMPQIYSSSVVHWARNQSVAQSLYGQPTGDPRPPCDYMFMMDDDMLVQPDYLSRLLSYKKDIVCGICTIRKDPPIPNIRLWSAEQARFYPPIEWDWDSQKLMEIDAAGAAFMLVKRTVLERMGEAYRNCEFEIAEYVRMLGAGSEEIATKAWAPKIAKRQQVYEDSLRDGNWKSADCWWFQFMGNVIDGQVGEIGEDLTFCWKAKKLGYQIWADPQVLPGHLGVYGYSIHDYRDFIEQSKKSGGYNPAKAPQNLVGLGAGA